MPGPSPRRFLPVLALAACATLPAPTGAADLPVHVLDNGTVRATVTAAIGGRLLSFALRGQPNFLLLDAAAGDPAAPVDAAGDNVPYFGHEVWVGPQSEWWVHQDANPQRAAARAAWPPDPWLNLSRYEVEASGPAAVTLRGPASPVSGVALRKRYALVVGRPDTLRLDARATNRRATGVAWDLWFNTRVPADTHVYVPVAHAGDVRAVPAQADRPAPRYRVDAGILALDVPAHGAASAATSDAAGGAPKGKMFLQPAAGWIAAFRGDQALLIRFDHQPRAAIHPEQGQVELYQDGGDIGADAGVLELEVHAPYRKLAPGAAMDAHELWTILPYRGAATPAAHLAFLRAHAGQAGLRMPAMHDK
ncbi:DUF4380 domain-containing protein [uncultured Massilia sp.]|uniref:DUF4380 domain-containing protein n=1 Tax=uncultured Massilia sp. TaxID=169973 RepID=UPI002601433B|nr:DUF4380 domain-containing protein [uncultured Massilia sp.]